MAIAKSQKSLKDWTEQKWMTSGTHANKKKGSSKEVKSQGKKRYLPEKAWSSLSKGEKLRFRAPKVTRDDFLIKLRLEFIIVF